MNINTFMLNSNKYSNRTTNQNTESESLNKLMHLGESMISDKKFNIKQYLETAETKFKIKQIKKKNLKGLINHSLDLLNYKNYNPKNFSNYTDDYFFNNNKKITDNSNRFRTENNNENKSNSLSKENLVRKMNNINYFSLSLDKNKNIREKLIPKKNINKMNYLNTYSNYTHNSILSNYNKKKIIERYNNTFADSNNTIKIINEEDKIDNNKNRNENEDNSEEDNKIFRVEKLVKQIRKNVNKRSKYNKYLYLGKIKKSYDKKDLLCAIDSDLVLNNYK